MTQRIINVPTDKLVSVLVTDLAEWPKEWGNWAVASRIQGGIGVWFCHREPRYKPGAGWVDVGTIEVFLDALPCDHLQALVSREYWLAHGLKSPNRRRIGAPAEHAKDVIEADRLMNEPAAVKIEGQATQCEYYECPVDHPQNPRQGGVAYIANCEDIIQALGLTFDEGCEFKSLWRRARARQGFVKAESTALRDAEKAHHYSGRVLAFERRKANK